MESDPVSVTDICLTAGKYDVVLHSVSSVIEFSVRFLDRPTH